MGEWNPVKISWRSPAISHLAFADDIILFTEASVEQTHVVRKIMEAFCLSSRQKVSNDKTRIYFSPNTTDRIREEICASLGFLMAEDLGK